MTDGEWEALLSVRDEFLLQYQYRGRVEGADGSILLVQKFIGMADNSNNLGHSTSGHDPKSIISHIYL